MGLAARHDTRLSVAAYKLWLDARPDAERRELLDGVPVLMAPPSGQRQRISSNGSMIRQPRRDAAPIGAWPS